MVTTLPINAYAHAHACLAISLKPITIRHHALPSPDSLAVIP